MRGCDGKITLGRRWPRGRAQRQSSEVNSSSHPPSIAVPHKRPRRHFITDSVLNHHVPDTHYLSRRIAHLNRPSFAPSLASRLAKLTSPSSPPSHQQPLSIDRRHDGPLATPIDTVDSTSTSDSPSPHSDCTSDRRPPPCGSPLVPGLVVRRSHLTFQSTRLPQPTPRLPPTQPAISLCGAHHNPTRTILHPPHPQPTADVRDLVPSTQLTLCPPS